MNTEKDTYLSKQLAVVSVVPMLCLIPFISKAFHIDDTVFLWCAKQIQSNPLDFYGFDANWYGTPQPMYLINQNPPLVSYLIAFGAWLFGWGETALHGFFILPAVCLSIGIFFLARFLCTQPWLASLAAVLTPVFLVSGTNIMSDILMLSFYVWAAVFWLYGLDRDRSVYLFISGILISAAVLTKYFGMSLIPLLFVYTLLKKRTFGFWIFYLIIPLMVIAGYQVITFLLYDNFLISNAAKYAIDRGPAKEIILLITRTFTGLSFTGGCMIGLLFFAPLIWSRKVLCSIGILLAVLIFVIIKIPSVRSTLLPTSNNADILLIIQYSVFVVSGLNIFLLAIVDMWKNRTPEPVLLFLWILGTFFFATYLNWTINGRVILPMLPAAGILVIRNLNDKIFLRSRTGILISVLPLIPSAFIALSTAWADTSLSDTQRSAANLFRDEFNNYPHTIWFQGHFGFQYYMEKIGAKALDLEKPQVETGNLVVVPDNNSNTHPMDKRYYHYVAKLKFMPLSWIGTMAYSKNAGFYCSDFGTLPFVFDTIVPEEYFLFLAGNFGNSSDAVNYFLKNMKTD